MPFFVEDFRWTSQNYASMSGKSVEMHRWWLLAEPIREILGQGPELKELGASSLLTIEAAGSSCRLRLRRQWVFLRNFNSSFLLLHSAGETCWKSSAIYMDELGTIRTRPRSTRLRMLIVHMLVYDYVTVHNVCYCVL